MSTPEYYLAIDQGGHASRAIVFDQHANIICQAECNVDTQTPRSNWVEHDPEQLISATFQAIHSCLHALDSDKQYIKAAGLATQRSSIACWNRNNGTALSAIISWQDCRHAEWLQQFEDSNKLIHHKTGLFLSPHYGASKIRWCLDNISAVKQALQDNELVIGPMASFLAYHLIKQRPLLADPANASRTLLWNINSQDWDDTLLKLFGIDSHILPPCTPSSGNFGHLEIDNINIPVTVITGDQSAALFAWGKPKPNTAYLNIGTGAFIQRPVAERQSNDKLLTSPTYVDGTYHCHSLEGTVNGAACALQWFAEKFAIQDIEKQVVECLMNPVTPPLFINTISGLGSPDWETQIEAQFIGAGSPPAKLLAVIESISFLIQRNLTEMAKTNCQPDNVIVSGGLSKLDGLCQQIADLSGITLIRPLDHEATATGLAYLIAKLPLLWPGFNKATTFTPSDNHEIKQRYQQWSITLAKIIADKT